MLHAKIGVEDLSVYLPLWGEETEGEDKGGEGSCSNDFGEERRPVYGRASKSQFLHLSAVLTQYESREDLSVD